MIKTYLLYTLFLKSDRKMLLIRR